MKPCLPLLLCLPLALAAAEPRLGYRCDNGSRLDLSFSADADGRPQATLHFADGEVVLPQVPAPAGERYRRDPVSLQIDGDEALIEDGHANRRHCRRADLAAAGSFVEIAGRVGYRGRLPASAELVILTQAFGRPDSRALTLAEQRYRLNGAPSPIPFTATVDRDLLGKDTRLGVSARIEYGGRTRLVGGPVDPVGAPGSAAAVEIELKPAGGRTRSGRRD